MPCQEIMKNPFPPRTLPEFVPYRNDLSRGVAIWRGHEYIVIRKEDLTPGDGLRAGDYGVSDDDWMFVIRDSDHVATARVSSQALNGQLRETPAKKKTWHDDYAREYGYRGKPPWALKAALDFCTSYPTSEESIRGGSASDECGMQVGGKHFQGDSTILGGDPIVLTVFMQGPPAWWTADEATVIENMLAFTDIWEKMEGWFLEQREASKKAAAGLPRQCEHCHGSGVVAR